MVPSCVLQRGRDIEGRIEEVSSILILSRLLVEDLTIWAIGER